ncbi:MAG: hypothetical protein HYX34_08775 [Actinobacteria bacterium]|nr:hypothetical protein [Actinomycetota bacterium]
MRETYVAQASKVIDIRRGRIARLEAELAKPLRLHGYVVADLAKIESVDEWRAAARAAGRRSGSHVRTGLSQNSARVWATIETM